ncbi:MAG: hypothetical protein GYA23_05845 [Methanomicrobiales archaeon]|nr:hypothetical protein [Methanomicrobiales archaeon]
MRFPCNFARYFTLALFLLLFGIVLVLIQTAFQFHDVTPLTHDQIEARAYYHSQVIVPALAKVFPLLFFLNAGVALFILIIPLFWVWVWWFNRDLLDIVIRMMQVTVGILMVALGHNSFDLVYLTYRLLPWQVIAVTFLPHGWLEMLAFVLAGTWAFMTIDALKPYLMAMKERPDLHPGDICLFILGRVWMAGLVIVIFIGIAAAIECFVTPVLIEAAFAAVLQGSW